MEPDGLNLAEAWGLACGGQEIQPYGHGGEDSLKSVALHVTSCSLLLPQE